MSERNLEPASTVLAKIGGVEAAAAITGKHVSRIYRWTYPRERGGTGGVIPHEDATKLLKHAVDHKIDLAPADFFVALTPENFDATFTGKPKTEQVA